MGFISSGLYQESELAREGLDKEFTGNGLWEYHRAKKLMLRHRIIHMSMEN